MKKLISFILVCFCIFTLCCCENTPVEKGMNVECGGQDADTVLESPPKLTVVRDTASVQALTGTASWTYQNPDGTSTSVMSDSLHPLQAKEYMTPLNILPSYKSSVDPLKAYLFFEVSPDKVEVRCWDESCWDKLDSQSETVLVTVTNSEIADRVGEKDFAISLKDDSYIYEIIAEWTCSEKYGGKVHYSFYTTSPHMTVYPIDNN